MNCMFGRAVLKVSALGDCNGNVNVLGSDYKHQVVWRQTDLNTVLMTFSCMWFITPVE